MKKHDEAAGPGRREFLKVAGGAAMAFASANKSYGQQAPAKAETRQINRPDEPADRGLWITWYDLPENGRDSYLSWLHDTYLPALLERPGYLWAAHYATQDIEGGPNSSRFHHVEDPNVPTGFRYVLLIAAANALVFGDPVPSVLHATLPEHDQKMLALRIGERMNLMTETGRREGRAKSAYKEGLTAAPCIQIGSFNCSLDYEEEMLSGYVQVRMPTMCNTDSSVRVRRLNSVVGWAKHGILYEFTSREGFNRDYAAAVARSPLGHGGRSLVPMLLHAPNGPNSADRIWSSFKGPGR
jgi:hypothetical protein